MILFKDPDKQRQYSRLHTKVKQITSTLAYLAKDLYGDDLVVTSIYREKDGSVHKHYRGIDIAILDKGGTDGSERIRRAINILYPYDVNRGKLDTIPVLNHGTAPHFHVQCK